MEETKKWVKSIIVTLLIFALFSIYLYLRRGYYNLYIINKVLGSTAAVIAGLTLVIGPLSKQVSYFARFLSIRKHLGLLALFLAILHIIASLLQQNKFVFPAWYLAEWLPVTFGFVAVLMWLYLMTISNTQKILKMGAEKWKKHLSLFGQLAFLMVFLHLTIMKYPGWVRWFEGKTKQSPELLNPQYPPASLFVLGIMLLVIIYRIFSLLHFKFKNKK